MLLYAVITVPKLKKKIRRLIDKFSLRILKILILKNNNSKKQ